jgi:phosphoribosylformylglycinamidine synthase
MDLKEPGNQLYLLGLTRNELGGSQLHLQTGRDGGDVPQVDIALAPRIFQKLHDAIRTGLVRSCHDVSDGGLAVAIAEMAFAGGVGVDITDSGRGFALESDEALLFSESTTRFILEVKRTDTAAIEDCFRGLPLTRLGSTCREQRLRIAGSSGEWIIWAELSELKDAWQKPLRW